MHADLAQQCSDAMLYSFALLPPAVVSDPCAAARARFDPDHAGKTVPHITMKQPFELRASLSGGEARLIECIKQVAAAREPFVVELGRVDVFHTSRFGSVVHLAVAPSDALSGLHAGLVRTIAALELPTAGLDADQEERLFYPHLTLAQGLTPAQASSVVRELTAPWPRSFVAVDLVVGRCGSDGVWHRPFVLQLGTSVRAPS